MPQRTILVADDETHILNVVSIKLQNAGFKVVTAEDGAAAHTLALSEHPDLIITDYQMPLLSGLELCSKLKANAATRETPVILLTARGFALTEADKSAGNIRRVIAKPFSPREVLNCVYELLDEANSLRAADQKGSPLDKRQDKTTGALTSG